MTSPEHHSPVSSERVEEIRQKAIAATPGEWRRASGTPNYRIYGNFREVGSAYQVRHRSKAGDMLVEADGHANADYIVAAQPQVIIDITTELLSLRKRNAELAGLRVASPVYDNPDEETQMRLAAEQPNDEIQSELDAQRAFYGWKGMASRSSIAAAIAAEDRRLLLEDGKRLLDTLPAEWHDEAITNFRDLVSSIEQRLARLTLEGGDKP